jgi:succinate-acetate transporter protein
MPNIPVNIVFVVIAVIFGLLSLKDFVDNDKTLSATGKIRFRMALIFAFVSAFLFFTI